MSEHQPRAIDSDVLRSLTKNTEPWLSCDDCFERLDEYVERRRSDPGHADAAMATHLEACAACAEEAGSLRALLAVRE
jgi:hypothetical protein